MNSLLAGMGMQNSGANVQANPFNPSLGVGSSMPPPVEIADEETKTQNAEKPLELDSSNNLMQQQQ